MYLCPVFKDLHFRSVAHSITGWTHWVWFEILLILTVHLHGFTCLQRPYLYYVVLTGDFHSLLTVIQGSEDRVTSPVDE